MERTLVPAAGIRACFLPMGAPRSPRGLVLLALATVRALRLILRHRPAAVLATGGYVSIPVSLAAGLTHVPLVIFLPDVVPGRAVAWLAPLARAIAAVTDETATRLPAGKTIVTGYPVRTIFLHPDREAGRRRFGTAAGEPLLLVFGGSQGSRAINQAMAAALPALLSRCTVVHVCGQARLAEAEHAVRGLPPMLRTRYTLTPYLQGRDMADAMAAADLVLCRAGASVIGELPLAGAPAVLVPLPDPAVHQHQNAAFLTSRGAAIELADADLATHLEATVLSLLDDPDRLDAMRTAMRSLARPDAAQRIARMVLDLTR